MNCRIISKLSLKIKMGFGIDYLDPKNPFIVHYHKTTLNVLMYEYWIYYQ
jgi:hypothetical protein